MYSTIISLFISFLVTLLVKFYLKKNKHVTTSTTKQYDTNSINNESITIALLTNELPPIVYGGVSTWILNFMKMFKDDSKIKVIPFFLAHIDDPHPSFFKNYPGIRILNKNSIQNDIKEHFKDIDICVNNLWVANDTVKMIKDFCPDLKMISVIHSLIKMEHLTNLGSIYTNNFFEQENTFKYSDYVVLISNAEEKYYNSFGYDKYKAKTCVIYNSYSPKFDNKKSDTVDYTNNTLGYIGRHVPRKRPELPIIAMNRYGKDNKVVNMGMTTNNKFWNKLDKKFSNLETINFSTDKSMIKKYWNKVGCNCITGIYEPFGYTMCETLDRMVPAIVQDLDGPKEIVDTFKDCIYSYSVSSDYNKDIDNFYQAFEKFLNTPPEIRKENAIKARKALDRFRPENISKQWQKLFEDIKSF
tara:strand:+ start:743 stop:1984 length:1242 start_codon:yes stop_codon:yes gene_type:complete